MGTNGKQYAEGKIMNISDMRKNETREFDGLACEKVLGWTWMQQANSRRHSQILKALLPPPHDKNYSPSPDGDNVWTPADNSTPRFDDWDECCRLNLSKHSWMTGIPHPSKSVADDYRILCHVREKWDDDNKSKFYHVMKDILLDRICLDEGIILAYLPGDYAEAALRVVMGEA